MDNKYNYKAYISYNHRDDKWASWLHRALEAYRVPRKLVGTITEVGEVPKRTNPVFRDRDDLSSAADLGGIVQQALAESYRRDRSNQSTFFELGQAEFYIGQTRFDQGELEKAEYAFMSYAEISDLPG